jgi:hypothetical protein
MDTAADGDDRLYLDFLEVATLCDLEHVRAPPIAGHRPRRHREHAVLLLLAFTVLENAMSSSYHRVAIRRRHFLVSAVMPCLFILFPGAGPLVATVVSGRLATSLRAKSP